MITKPTHFTNESSSCMDLIFSSNTSFVKKCRSELSIYEKCHRTVIYGTLSFDIPLPPPYYRDVGITNMQILNVFKKLFQSLIGLRLCSIEMQMKNAKY